MIPEFVGRLPIVAILDELDEQQLVRILTDPKNSLVKQYKHIFDMESCDIEFQDEALVAVAHKTMKRKTGARGLRSILETVLLDTMYDLPMLKDVSKVVVDSSVIESNSSPLILYDNDKKRALPE